MKSDDALLAAWEETLARKGDAPAVWDTRGQALRTFREIDSRARGLEAEIGASEGDVYPIDIGNHPDWPSHLLASLRLRLVALPLEGSVTPQQREAALAVCNASTGGGWGVSPPVLLKLTSGTTAAPRAIRFRSEQLVADCTQICDTMRIGPDDLNFGVIPLSHSYGFSNLVTPLLVRGVPLVVSRDRMPRAVLDDLARTGATVLPGMPVFYQAFCEMDAPELPKLRLCISAGAPLPLEIARKFREKFQRSIHSFYGSSECGGICYDREARLLEPGFVGPPMLGVQLEMLEPNAPASLIRVRSAAAGDGYLPEPDEEKLGGGFFSPDDLLSASEQGGFRIVGRISDVINVAGKKVNPAEVEAELLRFAGVRAAVVFGRSSTLRNEEVAACVVAGEGVREMELLEFCRRRLNGWQVPKRIFFLDEIPVNERGKISRRALAQRFDA
jgi:long-chain acyl-CoA synthetase